MNPTEIHSYKLDAALEHGQIAALGTEPRHATAADGSNFLIGVVIQPGPCAEGDIVDVAEDGTARVLAAGTIAIGDWIGPDSSGSGIKATSGRVVGYALEAGAAGDLILVRIQPTVLSSAT